MVGHSFESGSVKREATTQGLVIMAAEAVSVHESLFRPLGLWRSLRTGADRFGLR